MMKSRNLLWPILAASLVACGPSVDPDTCPPADDPTCKLTAELYISTEDRADTQSALQMLCDTRCTELDGALHFHPPGVARPSEQKLLAKLRKMRSLIIEQADDLVDLAGFENVKELGSLEILNNPKLSSLRGLQNLEKVKGAVQIGGNPNLASLDGFDSLETIGPQGLIIGRNDKLQSLDGFPKLEVPDTGISVQVSSNASLMRLGPLGNPKRLTSLTIIDNAKLSTLDGLGSLEKAHLSIYENGHLPQCAVNALAARVDPNVDVRSITPNDPNGVCE